MEHDIDEYDVQDWDAVTNLFNDQKYRKYQFRIFVKMGDTEMITFMRKEYIEPSLQFMRDLLKTFEEHPYPAIVAHLRNNTMARTS